MRDFNFFDELRQKKKAKTSTSTYIAGVVLVLALVLGIVSYIYIIELNNLSSEKIALEDKLNDGTHQQNYNAAVAVQEELALVENQKIELEQIHSRLLDSRYINNLLIKEIALAKPDALAVLSINFFQGGIAIEGTSINKDLIAKFEHNLRGNDRFTGPFIPMIQKVNEWTYSFTLSMAIDHPVEIEEEVVTNGEG